MDRRLSFGLVFLLVFLVGLGFRLLMYFLRPGSLVFGGCSVGLNPDSFAYFSDRFFLNGLLCWPDFFVIVPLFLIVLFFFLFCFLNKASLWGAFFGGLWLVLNGFFFGVSYFGYIDNSLWLVFFVFLLFFVLCLRNWFLVLVLLLIGFLSKPSLFSFDKWFGFFS